MSLHNLFSCHGPDWVPWSRVILGIHEKEKCWSSSRPCCLGSVGPVPPKPHRWEWGRDVSPEKTSRCSWWEEEINMGQKSAKTQGSPWHSASTLFWRTQVPVLPHSIPFNPGIQGSHQMALSSFPYTYLSSYSLPPRPPTGPFASPQVTSFIFPPPHICCCSCLCHELLS